MPARYQLIVLGLGAVGSAALYQASKLGIKVLGVDQFSPPHTQGSTHGDTRLTRQAIGEGEHYVPLVLRSYELWREIEAATNTELLTITGGLIISSKASKTRSHVPGFFQNTLAAARKHNIRHEILDAAQIRRRFPQFNIRDDEVGYYEYNAGFLRPESCVRAQLLLAQKLGADLRTNEKAISFCEHNGGVRVTTTAGEHDAERLIVCAGPWLPSLLEQEYAKHFKVMPQTLFWFDTKSGIEQFQPGRFLVFIWELQGRTHGIYGFPAINGPGGGVKIATEYDDAIPSADSPRPPLSDRDIGAMFDECVAPNFPGLDAKCIKTVSCLYTVTSDASFIIDWHPQMPSVLLASPCSGHGFKHSASVGEALAQLAIEGRAQIDLSPFALSRRQS